MSWILLVFRMGGEYRVAFGKYTHHELMRRKCDDRRRTTIGEQQPPSNMPPSSCGAWSFDTGPNITYLFSCLFSVSFLFTPLFLM